MKQDEINFFINKILKIDVDPNDITIKDLNELIFPKKRYRIIGVYGKGQYGLILKIKSNKTAETYAVKLAQVKSYSLDEFHIQQKFAEYNMAPKLFLYDITEAIFKNQKVKFVRAVMDPIRNTIFQYIKQGNSSKLLHKPFECLIKKKYLLGYPNPYLHCDMHCSNIVILQDGKTLGFIDFGMSKRKQASLQILDFIPLIASCQSSLPKISKRLCIFLAKFYNKLFNVNIDISKLCFHPGGGYAYESNGYYLHSYDWKSSQHRNPLPTISEIKTIFPTFTPPGVK